MTRRVFFSLLIAGALLSSPGVAWGQHTEAKEAEVEAALQAEIGANFTLATLLKVDDALREGPPGGTIVQLPIRDPYGTLEGAYVFSASSDDSARGTVGVYRNGQITWYAGPFEIKQIEYPTNIAGILDLNQDGKVEILSWWVTSNVNTLRIYSWDGQSGERAYALDDPSGIGDLSEILVDSRGYFILVDREGDGVWEILAAQGKVDPNAPPDQFPRPHVPNFSLYYWDGSVYRWDENAPENPHDYELPRDRVDVEVQAKVWPTGGSYRYSYVISNASSSLQHINEIYLGTQADSIRAYTARNKWNIDRQWGSRYGVAWNGKHERPPNYIAPGETDSSFSFTSPELPVIDTYHILGKNGNLATLPYDFEETELEREHEYITNYAKKGETVVAAPRPEESEYQGYLDTLRTDPSRAFGQGWITSDAAASRYEEKLNAAHDYLAAADSALAQQALSEVAAQAQADSGDVFTPEGYALLHYNSRFLAERLPASPLAALPGALAVADGSGPAPSFAVNGTAFRLAGRAHAHDGTEAPGLAPAYAAVLPTEAGRAALRQALIPAQQERLTGRGSAPSIGVGPVPFDAEALAENVAAQAGRTLGSRAQGTVGTVEAPVLAYAPNGLSVSGQLEGAGVLVVEGHLSVSGTLEWKGLVLHRGGPSSGPALMVSNRLAVDGGMVLIGGGRSPASVQVNRALEVRYSPALLLEAAGRALEAKGLTVE